MQAPEAPQLPTARPEEACRRQARSRTDRLIGVLSITALLLLLAGLVTPVVVVDRLGSVDSPASILVAIGRLWATGSLLLAGIILLFSVLFPVAKILMLLAFWVRPRSPEKRRAAAARVELLGKWSMLDVFVVCLTVGAMELGILADSEVRPGAYVFCAAVILSMVTTGIAGARNRSEVQTPVDPPARRRLVGSVALLTFSMLAVSVVVPLLTVEKWYFWKQDYSLFEGARQMIRERHAFLAVLLAALVAVVPAAVLAGTALLCLLPESGSLRTSSARLVRHLRPWAMVDVFLLGLLVFVSKAATELTVKLHSGFWLLVAATVGSVVVEWAMRSSPSPNDS